MRTVKINAILLLLIIVCACCSTAGAKEKKITKQIIKMAPREEIQTSGMCINDGGKVCLIRYDNTAAVDRDDNYYTVLDIKQINDSSFRTKHKIKHKFRKADEDGSVEYVRLLDKTVIVVEANFDNKYTYVTEYNLNGKKLFSFKDKIEKVNSSYFSYCDIWDDGNNIYYVYWQDLFDDDKNSGAELKCVNKTTGKIKTLKQFKTHSRRFSDCSITISDGYVYELTETDIYVYNLRGKRISRYKLPEGRHSLYNENTDPDEFRYLVKHCINVCGKNIYYCNNNGIYKCNTKKSKKFRKIYDGSGDEYFGHDYGVDDIKVADKNTFYVSYIPGSAYEVCGDYTKRIFVRYKKSNR